MSKREKRLRKIRQNPTDVSFDELKQLLADYGIILFGSKGSHHSFEYYLDGKRKQFVIPYHKPIKPFYVKTALRVIEAIVIERGEDEPDK